MRSSRVYKLKKRIPRWAGKWLSWMWVYSRRLWRRSHLLNRALRPARGGVVLSLGGTLDRIGHGSIIHGGRVKLLHLDSAFQIDDSRFNILYLVSSAIPEFAEDLVTWAKKRGVRLVWNQNGVAYPAWAGAGYEQTNARMAWFLRVADYVIYQSEFCRRSADRYLGPAEAPWMIAYNCVDTHVFRPRNVSLPETPWIILAAGSHLQRERVVSVLETVAVLQQRRTDVRLILAGRFNWEGSERDVVESIEKLGIATLVEFQPPYKQSEAPDLYRRAHVLLHTKYKDPCPTVVVEAMASGIPVVGSRSGGMPELVGDEGGILIDVPETWDEMPVPGAREMADAVTCIMGDLETWKKDARQRAVREFDKYVWIGRHREVFSKVLGQDDQSPIAQGM